MSVEGYLALSSSDGAAVLWAYSRADKALFLERRSSLYNFDPNLIFLALRDSKSGNHFFFVP
jgi:hypothetical protein